MGYLTEDLRSFDGSLESFYVSVEDAWKRSFRQTYAQRHGQYVMNALAQVRPDLYHKVTGALWDPFYRDGNLPEFWRWMERIWDGN